MTLTLDRQFDLFYFSRNADLATYIRKIDCFPDSRFDPNFFLWITYILRSKKDCLLRVAFCLLGVQIIQKPRNFNVANIVSICPKADSVQI